jgi:hypothetical protein
MSNNSYAKLSWALILLWFVTAVTASAQHVFLNTDARFGLPVAVAALTPLILFLVWFASSPGFRNFALSLDARWLTLVQTWRVGGLVFVVLASFGILPNIFAQPAGWGDFFIGATAPFVMWKLANPEHRRGFIFWQVLGILDLVNAVALGTTARIISPEGPAMGAMTVLPLSMVPTFLVPLLFMFHVISIAQAARWPERPGRFPAPARAAAI